MRAELRQAAFAAAMKGAGTIEAELPFDPSPPGPFTGMRRPLCALLDGAGEHMTLAILAELAHGRARLFAPPPPRRPAAVRLGRMWAELGENGWRLLALRPAFE